MSVENFDGDGYADQSSIIYSFGDKKIRELSRSGYGEPGPSPGEVVERDETKSDPTDELPVLDLPGQDGRYREDCGTDIPAFSCLGESGCGQPVYVGRTCANPTCERDWAAAVKRNVVTKAGKLDGLRRALYARYDGQKNIDINHVVASPPAGFAVDSDAPLKRALLIIKTILEKQWNIDGFVAIYHPYRIKKEYRKDQYEHGGEEGEGDMTWKDVLSEDDPYRYLTFEPHFHLFFPAVRASFDYLTAEAIEAQSGWLFHRIEKSGEENHKSVENLDDLVHQLTYCYSHAGVREVGPRDELASRMKGDLHNCYIPDGVEDETLAMFCDAAPKLLGVTFANVADATCSAEVSSESEGSADVDGDDDDDFDHPLDRVWNPTAGSTTGVERTANAWDDAFSQLSTDGSASGVDWTGGTGLSSGSESDEIDEIDEDVDPSTAAEDEADSPLVDDRVQCGGQLRPMHEAESRLEDEQWCRQAEYVAGLRDAYREWTSLDDQDHPWVDSPDDDDADDYPGVVKRD